MNLCKEFLISEGPNRREIAIKLVADFLSIINFSSIDVICSYQNLFTACKLRPKTQSEARPYDKVIVVHTAAKFSVSSDVT